MGTKEDLRTNAADETSYLKARATDTQSYWHCFVNKGHYSLLTRDGCDRWGSTECM